VERKKIEVEVFLESWESLGSFDCYHLERVYDKEVYSSPRLVTNNMFSRRTVTPVLTHTSNNP
jgi:hypothetical protein